ncbi:hypothetical protein [Bradyrhizobium erythrophlei]|uniref:Uncharacterized protein n=1 Tax=Bradyrhizobium erythrophlei TaxID=1437360 RepID=A0A1M5T940_9BRAD|nr:hypothetical protein [Bradyrhizobium erythrophlei]SHH47218.1 hypothetical protein SAMN05444169_7623 [Bradyrhizobium erythrophlei]
MASIIIVQYTPHYKSGAVGSRAETDFLDWFEFADWMKQTNLTGCTLAIHEWYYSPVTTPDTDNIDWDLIAEKRLGQS